ncbi:MAG: hypothetical protein SFY32_17455 [Bacteroidota bacterium]|nr:hypothetical protein [Bacteroidota bacterium]
MNLQYISDNKGITTGVFIPIQEWNMLKENYNLPEDDFEFNPTQKKELNDRIDHYLKNPNDLLDWEEVEKRLLARNAK